jgi:hypothetical protein
MLILIGLVANGNPSMLTDPHGALVKDFCLIACAITLWILAPIAEIAEELNDSAPMLPGFEDEFQD